MYLVAIGWLYVGLMMSVAEAMHPDGTVLGAIVTFFLYGLLPVALVMYVLGTPLRRKSRLAREAQEDAAARAAGAAALAQSPASIEPDAGGHSAGAAQTPGITPVRKPD
jgi:membrane protein implicated in regulation of membrane protease activity